MTVSAAEHFLADFHDRDPGGSPRAFAHLPVHDDSGHGFPSTYDALCQAVAREDDGSGPLLDLACGNGHLLAALAASGRPLTGVDLSTGELDAARARLGNRARLIQARGQQMPLPGGSQSIVTCHMALMLMSPAEAVLAEVRRVLRPGGRLMALLPRADAPGSPRPPLIAAWLQALAGCDRDVRWADVRFDTGAWCQVQALPALLQPHFDAPRLTRLHGEQRLTPDQAWRWFTGMYDLHLLPRSRWPEVRERFVSLLPPLLEADGCARLPHAYLLMTATAVT